MRNPLPTLLLVVVLVIGLSSCAGCQTYNNLVGLDEQVNQSWADLQSQYQRRADLIPNLVSTVRGAADFEAETLEAVVAARSRATSIQVTADDLDDPQRMEQFFAAQQQLGGALGRLLAVAEAYPQLRATESFRDLQVQLEGTENRIATARRDYNTTVRQFNSEVRRFPTNVFAGIFGFNRRTPFEATAGADQAPTVRFD